MLRCSGSMTDHSKWILPCFFQLLFADISIFFYSLLSILQSPAQACRLWRMIGNTRSSLLTTHQWTCTVRGLFKSLTPNMSNKNSDTEKDHATIVSSHFYIYVIKKLLLSCRPWNSALYGLSGIKWFMDHF